MILELCQVGAAPAHNILWRDKGLGARAKKARSKGHGTMRSRFIAAGIMVIAIITAGPAREACAQAKDAEAPRAAAPAAPAVDYSQLAVALFKTGMNFTQVKEGNWSIPLETKAGKKYNMNIIANQEILSFFVLISEIKGTPGAGLDKKLAELNDSYLIIKFLYNKSALYLRIDTLLDGIRAENIAKYAFIVNNAIEKELTALTAFVPAPPKEKEDPKGQK